MRPQSGRNFMADRICVHMTEDAARNHEELLTHLLKEKKWTRKFSERYIEDRLLSIYAATVQTQSPEELLRRFEELVQEFSQYAKEYRCLIPLAGVAAVQDGIEIGRIRLRRFSLQGLAEELGIGDLLENDSIKESFESATLKGRQDVTFAEFSVVAEQGRATEMARTECERMFDVLRYAIPYVTEPHLNVAVGFEYEIQGDGQMRIFCDECEKKRALGGSIHHRNFAFTELRVDGNCLQKMEKIGAMRLSSILKKPSEQLTEFEEIVLRGAHWYSAGRKVREAENSFLNYTTVLETFFTPPKGDPIAATIADGCAFVLGESVERRMRISQRIKKLYGARCGLSHGSSLGILETELDEMEHGAWLVLKWMIEHIDQFKTHEDLRSWLEEKKFS